MPSAKAPRGSSVPNAAKIRKFLSAADNDYLVDLLMGTFRDSPRTKQKILMDMVDRSDGAADIAAYRGMIKKTLGSNTFIDYYKMHLYAKNARELIERIGGLLNRNQAADARELAEYAIENVVDTTSQSDNSDGYMTELVSSLLDIHLTACRAAPPDPLHLARKLFEWDMSTIMDISYSDADDDDEYKEILGETGRAEFRRLVEEAWAGIQSGSGDRVSKFRLTELMESFAVEDGDFEELIALQKRNATSGHGYWNVTRTYLSVHQFDQAIAWLESGLRTLAPEHHWLIRTHLITVHQKVGDHDKAMEIAWENFSSSKGYQGYGILREVALVSGDWHAVRTKALAEIKSNLIEQKKRSTSSYFRPDFSDLVRIYLEEDELESAWQSAQEGGCGNQLALRLADLREEKHPEESLRIYRAQFENQILNASGDYRAEVGLLQAINRVMKRLGRGGEFTLYLAKFTEEYKRRKNFLLRIKEADWSGN